MSNLIPRLYDVTSGAVLIDGLDVRAVTLESLRDSIGVVAQDPHLFHDTIRNNLQYARPNATDEQIVSACKDAQIYDKTIWLFGGPRVDHKTALELGFDAGFGPGTKPSDVANYIYYRLLERQGRAPAPQPTAHGTQDATIQGTKA